jgi:hypothetical protein
MKTYEARVATLQAMMACLGYWGRDKADDIVIKSLNIFAESEKDKTGYTLWNKLRLYPALILIYSLGLSALANNDYTLLGNMFLKPQNKYNGIEYTPLVLDLYAANVFERDAGNWIPGHEKEFTPVNNYLFETIRPTLRDYIIEERQYEDLFDRFEYLQSLIIADILLHKENIAWGPPGRFGWKGIRYPKRHISSTFAEEISQMSESVPHPILMWFGNSLERLNKAKSTVDESVRQRAWY